MGNIVLRDSIDAKTWSDFDDLLLKNEENAIITGNKKFLSGVTLESTIRVTRINGHAFSEFVYLDADQQFPSECPNYKYYSIAKASACDDSRLHLAGKLDLNETALGPFQT